MAKAKEISVKITYGKRKIGKAKKGKSKKERKTKPNRGQG
jgi:hypothetical protein